MHRTLVRAGVIPAVLALLAGCDVIPTIEAHAAYARFTTDGDVGLETNSGQIDRVDIADDLGLDDPGNALYLQSRLQTVVGNVNVSAFRFEESGSGVLDAGTGFGGIGGGGTDTPVRSDFEMTNAKAFYSFDLLDVGVFRIAPGLGVDLFDIDTTVRSVDSPISGLERIQVLAPVPMVFLDASAEIGGLRADVEAGWVTISLDDASGTWVDLEARVLYEVVDYVDLMAGYRLITMDVDGDADGQRFDADLAVHGFYVGGGVRW